MIKPRKLNSSHPMSKLTPGTLPSAPPRPRTEGEGIARIGASKHIVDAAPVPGMKRQSAPSHEFLHGAPINGEPLQTTYENTAPIHPAMTSRKDRGQQVEGQGSAVLIEASNLGRI
jgi:hypothetical protein